MNTKNDKKTPKKVIINKNKVNKIESMTQESLDLEDLINDFDTKQDESMTPDGLIYSDSNNEYKTNNEEINKVIDFFNLRQDVVMNVKDKPTPIEIPITIEQMILEINYIYDSNLSTEIELENWINEMNIKQLTYAYNKYLIKWKVLTNNINIFSPNNNNLNINVIPVIKFDKFIPEILANKIKFEEVEYD